MPVADWFFEWAGRHMDRFPRGDWPELGAEYWKSLLHLFVTKGVVEEVAEEASLLLFESPPKFPDSHPEALLAQVRLIWRETRAAANPIRPGAAREDNSSWNARADAGWASLLEGEKDRWRAEVARRFPWGKGHHINESIAKAWAYDPGLMEGICFLSDLPDWGPDHVLGEKKRRERKADREMALALRFLVNALAVEPTRLVKVLMVANDVEISHGAIFEAAEKLGVIKTIEAGEEVWDLERGGGR